MSGIKIILKVIKKGTRKIALCMNATIVARSWPQEKI
jgi:hypothetical protein